MVGMVDCSSDNIYHVVQGLCKGTAPLMLPFEHYKMCGARVIIGRLHVSRLLYR
jgi:uncharacterized protein (DUF779 family)